MHPCPPRPAIGLWVCAPARLQEVRDQFLKMVLVRRGKSMVTATGADARNGRRTKLSTASRRRVSTRRTSKLSRRVPDARLTQKHSTAPGPRKAGGGTGLRNFADPCASCPHERGFGSSASPLCPNPNSIADKYDMTRSGSLFGTRAAIASRLAWRLLPSRAFPRRGAGGQRSEASGSRVLPSNHAPAGSTRRSADPRTEHSRGRRHPRRPTDRACPATSPAAGYTAPAATASTGRVRPARPRAMGTGHPYWLSSIEPAQSSA